MSDENNQIAPADVDLSKVSDQRLDFMFPKQAIRVRITDAEDVFSKNKQTPMRVLRYEIVSPEKLTVNEKEWVVSGFKLMENFVWSNDIAQRRIKNLHKILNLSEDGKPMPLRWKNDINIILHWTL